MFDIHAHIQDQRLDPCRERVLTLAAELGIKHICCCATSPQDWERVLSLSMVMWPLQLIPAFGVHPWYAGSLPADWPDKLDQLLASHRQAACGECGVCGVRREVSPEVQLEVLRCQLGLAVKHSRPVILHGARAWGALLDAVRPYAARLPAMVAHSFGGSADILRQWIKLGGYVSFSGTVCNPAAKLVQAAAALVPESHLLVETDSPDLFPIGGLPCRTAANTMTVHPSPLNQPANLPMIISAVAALRGATTAHIAATTTANAMDILKMPVTSA